MVEGIVEDGENLFWGNFGLCDCIMRSYWLATMTATWHLATSFGMDLSQMGLFTRLVDRAELENGDIWEWGIAFVMWVMIHISRVIVFVKKKNEKFILFFFAW